MFEADDDKSKNKVLNYMDKDGNFYILGEFDSSISENVVPNLVKRIQEEEDKPNPSIWFYINSNGGYCHELYNLLSLIDIAKTKGIKIYTVVTGRAYSCGSMLAIHGDHRAIYKYGNHLMHLGSTGEEVHTFKQIERTNDNWKEHFNNIVKMYVDNTNMTEKEVREHLKDDLCWLNAEQCKKLGLVDEILGEPIPVPTVKVADNDTITVNGMKLKIVVDEKRQAKEKAKEKARQEKKKNKNKQKGKNENKKDSTNNAEKL